ncbi:hypothetical protein D3C76_1604620 [compost metagenome]
MNIIDWQQTRDDLLKGFSGQFSACHAGFQPSTNPVDGAGHHVRGDVVHQHLMSAAGSHFRDPGAHRAAANHGDGVNSHRHLISP